MTESYTDIKPGSIIVPQQGGVAVYVFDYITSDGGVDPKNRTGVLGYPVIHSDEVISGNRAVTISSKHIESESIGNIRIPKPCVMVGANSLQRIPIDEDHFYAEVLDKTTETFQTEINAVRKEVDPNTRVSDIEVAEDVRVFRYDNIASVSEPRAFTEPKEGASRKQRKAKSFTYVPDMYLEDAVEAGIFSKEAYLALQNNRDEIVTLQDAWQFAKTLDSSGIKVNGLPVFDDAFPNAFMPYEEGIEQITLRGEMEGAVSQHPVTEFADKNEVSLERLLELKLISQSTFDIFTKQPKESEYPSCTLLGDAIRQIGAHGYTLEEYRRPNLPHLFITYNMRLQAEAEVTAVFDLLTEKLETNDIDKTSILNTRSKFMSEFARSNDERIFQRHQPDRKVVKNLETALRADLAKIKSDRPSALTV